jgi:hypothetical protein
MSFLCRYIEKTLHFKKQKNYTAFSMPAPLASVGASWDDVGSLRCAYIVEMATIKQ